MANLVGLSTGIYRANTTEIFYSLSLTQGENVFLEVSGDNGASSIYDSQMGYLRKTTSGTPLFLEAGNYTVRASYSSPNLAVMNVYIPSMASFGALPELSTGTYPAASYDNFYALNIGSAGNVLLAASGDSARLVIYDDSLNFIKYSNNGFTHLDAGKYIVMASFNGYRNGVLNANIPEALKIVDKSINQPPVLSGDDIFYGSESADLAQGFSGNDRFTGNFDYNKSDAFFGGDGIDSAVYRGLRGDYELKIGETFADLRKPDGVLINGVVVLDKVHSRDGTDYLHEVERLHFLDKSIALDNNGVAGQAFRLYQAAFARQPDSGGLGFWMSFMDKGMSLEEVAHQFFASAEFQNLYGANPTDELFIKKLYSNVLHRTPEADGLAFWMDALHGGTPRENVLAFFSESPENQAALIGVTANGIAYIPFG